MFYSSCKINYGYKKETGYDKIDTKYENEINVHSKFTTLKKTARNM